MKSISLTFILLPIILTPNLFAQDNNQENWVKVKSSIDTKLYIDVNSIDTTNGNDIYVWTLEYHEPPLVIESIDGKIYKSKTYYLINKELKKYSIIEIIYFDRDNNVLGDFNYQRDTSLEEYRYNYPIMLDSDLDLIYEECLKFLWKE
jgi:hypothetical protein